LSYIEVRFYPEEDDDYKTFAPLCDRIRRNLLEGIDEAISQLNYNKTFVGRAQSLKCHSCKELHKLKDNPKKIKVSCCENKNPGNCCSCWFNQGIEVHFW